MDTFGDGTSNLLGVVGWVARSTPDAIDAELPIPTGFVVVGAVDFSPGVASSQFYSPSL